MSASYEITDIDLDVAHDALQHCNAFERDEWVQMGMALKSEFGEAGFSVWEEWSQSFPQYKPADARTVWRSFKRSGIGIGTLIDTALKAGFQFERKTVTDDERLALNKQRDERLEKLKIEQALAQEKIDDWRLRLSDFLTSIIGHFDTKGKSEYLKTKHIEAFGLLFAREPMVVVADQDRDLLELHYGHDRFTAFLKLPKEQKPKFRLIKKGVFAIPLIDDRARVWNMQLIYDGGGKYFFPGRKSGCFHLIGEIPKTGLFDLCQAEGYANAAVIHMALKCPVIVAFDSGNMEPVAKSVFARFGDRINHYVMCADNDVHLVGENKANVGLVKATKSAAAVGGVVVIPIIEEDVVELSKKDPLYNEASEFVVAAQKITISSIQRQLRVGYNRASAIVDQLEMAKIISPAAKNGRRKVLVENLSVGGAPDVIDVETALSEAFEGVE